MQNGTLFLFVLAAAALGAAYLHDRRQTAAAVEVYDGDPPAVRAPRRAVSAPPAATPKFACDGRTRCPQMRSCEEARYFLRNCPGAAMDGDHDGEPCEDQWCRTPF